MIKKTMIICLMAVMGVITASAQSVYDFKVKDDAGSDVQLELNPTLSTIMARRSVRKYQANLWTEILVAAFLAVDFPILELSIPSLSSSWPYPWVQSAKHNQCHRTRRKEQ